MIDDHSRFRFYPFQQEMIRRVDPVLLCGPGRKDSLIEFGNSKIIQERLAADDSASANDCTLDYLDLLDQFGAVRSNGFSCVSTFRGAELVHGGVHPAIEHAEVMNLFHEWICNGLNPCRQIDASIQRVLRNRPGEMQQFHNSCRSVTILILGQIQQLLYGNKLMICC